MAVLRANDVGGWTKPAPRLYPHQWSWDSAFIAIGLAHLDPGRALGELEHLFEAQWTDGRVPHIVINWLLWCGLRAHGLELEAARLREANLALLARPEAHFAEYFEPFTAEPLGSPNQSWTAAVKLDWLAAG